MRHRMPGTMSSRNLSASKSGVMTNRMKRETGMVRGKNKFEATARNAIQQPNCPLKSLKSTVGKLAKRYNTRRFVCMCDLRPTRFKSNKNLQGKKIIYKIFEKQTEYLFHQQSQKWLIDETKASNENRNHGHNILNEDVLQICSNTTYYLFLIQACLEACMTNKLTMKATDLTTISGSIQKLYSPPSKFKWT